MAETDTKSETLSEAVDETMDEKKEEEAVKAENKDELSEDSDNELKSTTDSPVKTTMESSNETSKKSPTKELQTEKNENEDEDDDDDDDDEDEEELPPGLLEQPLEVTGKREKKKVERLSATMVPSAATEKKKVEIEQGSGEKLGDIPYIEHQLMMTKAADLKPLHRLLFARLGTSHELKRNLRQFCGFTQGKDSKEYERRMTTLNKFFLNDLKSICLTLGVDRGGSKKDIIERIMEFLMNPKDTGAQVKVKRRSKSTGAKPGKKRKRTSKKSEKSADKPSKKKKKKEKTTEDDEQEDEKDEESAKEDASEEEEEEEQEEENGDDAEEAGSESEEEEPKPKKTKTESKQKPEKKKKATPKKVAKVNGKTEKAAKSEAKKASPKKKKAPVTLDDDLSSDDSEDEPIAKMKKSPPSNDEIKDLVKTILEGADLETVTMKTVVKQVYAKYPTFDLSDRKDFIKETVREVIS